MPAPKRPRVATIVPVFNEEATLAAVLSTLRSISRLEEILVVSDGSTDATVEIARAAKVKAIHLKTNQGKATAMAAGVAHTSAPVVLFVDGDILHLSTSDVESLLEPVVSGRAAMSIGGRHRGPTLDAIYTRFGPRLSGIRCLRREVFEAIPERFLDGFCIETALNWACERLGWRAETLILHGLEHVVKEKKRGLVAGTWARIGMFTTVFLAYARLQLTQPSLRNTRPASPPQQQQLELEYINF
jgi:glycosyltransferase involved in cell wall biosynthesis